MNKDDSSFDFLDEITPVRKISYSQLGPADVWAEHTSIRPDGLRFTACQPEARTHIRSSLVGRYNVSNCLAAYAATALGLSLPVEAVREGIRCLEGVPGRMERIELGQSFSAIVDFAHTPNALARSLETARELTSGRIIAVFGSAGLRDREKRRMMAEVSVKNADFTILTAEDPRIERLEDILAEMAAGAESKGGIEGKTFWRVPDRGEALRRAVQMAGPGDLVIACGKGHEQSMCFGAEEYPWDDRTAMRAALSELLHIPGPKMPYLPTQDI